MSACHRSAGSLPRLLTGSCKTPLSIVAVGPSDNTRPWWGRAAWHPRTQIFWNIYYHAKKTEREVTRFDKSTQRGQSTNTQGTPTHPLPQEAWPHNPNFFIRAMSMFDWLEFWWADSFPQNLGGSCSKFSARFLIREEWKVWHETFVWGRDRSLQL